MARPDSFALPPLSFTGGETHHDSETYQEDGQTTPTMPNPTTPVSPFSPEEKIHLLGSPSPPPPLLSGKGIEVLARRSVGPLGTVSSAMWKRAFKSCLLVAKVG
ncbi:hypothetical protein C0991_000921 [Blastosporella zonata]|nr:hypothetical protein C0991_000921 [Blastosporella zonata]